MARTGIGYLTNALNSTGNLSNLDSTVENLDLKVIPARVIDIVLDETHPKFSQYGGWSGIGTINFEEINTLEASTTQNPIAKPFFPQFKSPPLINEIVLLIHLPDKDMGGNDTSKIYYYLNSISLWNHPHHNAYPNVYQFQNKKNTQKNYQEIENGVINSTSNKSKPIDLNGSNNTGGTFNEKSSIQPLIPFSGDNIIESRFGSSIRLGSTSKTNTLIRNNWSEYGDNGEPLIILKNGQPTTNNKAGFLPTVENINEDPSSIYITSTQNIPISASSLNFTALDKSQTPIYPGSYTDNPQIILNSGRLVLNSNKDSILMSSPKVINLAAIGDIGIASRKSITLEADYINLGGTNSSQPAIIGDTFLKQLKGLTSAIQSLANALNNDPKVAPTTQFAGNILNEQVKIFNNSYDQFTSKKVKIS
jgi:hypothetical protein